MYWKDMKNQGKTEDNKITLFINQLLSIIDELIITDGE